jgi:hypothetical protein
VIIETGKRAKRFERASKVAPHLILLLQHFEYEGLCIRVMARSGEGNGYSEVERLAEAQFATRLTGKLPVWLSRSDK